MTALTFVNVLQFNIITLVISYFVKQDNLEQKSTKTQKLTIHT